MAPKTDIEERKRALLAASQMVRQAAKERGVTLKDTLRAGEKVRKEIYNEWFGKRRAKPSRPL